MIFPCTKCGACCRRAHLVQPFLWGDCIHGGCIMLSADNLCEVYKSRPLICNIEKSKELLYPDKDMSKHYKDSAEICNRFIKEDGMDEKYLIDMKQFED